MDNNKSFFDAFSPKGAFVAGIISAILILGTVGFIIMMVMVLTGSSLNFGGGSNNGNGAAVVNNQPTDPNAPAGPITFAEVDEDVDHIRGDKNAKVTIIEYSDLECPFCKNFHLTLKDVVAKNEGKVRWVYRHFPLDGLHSQARPEAEAAECASEQGKFWEFIDTIFENTPSNNGLDLAKLPDYAKTAGVKDIEKFKNCVSSKKYADAVQRDVVDAEGAGGRGTPYSLVIGKDGTPIPVNGALPATSIQQAIDSLGQ